MKYYGMLRTFFLLVLSLNATSLFAQQSNSEKIDFDIKTQSMYLPVPQKAGKFDQSFSVNMIYLPQAWLDAAYSVPMFDYKVNYSLGKGYAINTNIKTLLVANDLRLGFSWNHSMSNNWYVGLGYQVAYNFGALKDFGFDNTLKVLQHHPTVRIGYEHNNRAYTFQGKLDYIGKTSFSLGENSKDNQLNIVNGFSTGFFMEQRLTQKKSFCIGLIANYDQFHIMAWPAFSVVRQQYFIPEINFGFKL